MGYFYNPLRRSAWNYFGRKICHKFAYNVLLKKLKAYESSEALLQKI